MNDAAFTCVVGVPALPHIHGLTEDESSHVGVCTCINILELTPSLKKRAAVFESTAAAKNSKFPLAA